MNNKRRILHVDLNSFFATCEQQDNSEWRGKPLGVVQDSGKRSVIIASSIEAKALGIGTGHKVWEAQARCPQIILVPAKFDRYIYYARRFREICQHYAYKVEVFSVDELFMDITKTAHVFGGITALSDQLKKRLKEEVGDYLTCSVGIAPNKMLAKLASGSQKPDGLVIVDEKNKLNFLDRHEIWHICGIGHRIQKRLNGLGVFTVRQLRQLPSSILESEFGIMGKTYHLWSMGEDPSEVALSKVVPADKSYGNQITLPKPVGVDKAKSTILWLCWQVASRMRKKAVGAKTISLHIRTADKRSMHAQKSVSFGSTALDLYHGCLFILEKKFDFDGQIRFVGVSASNLLPLSDKTIPLMNFENRWQKISKAWDSISAKYDPFYLRPARLLNMKLKETEFNGFTKKY